LLICCVALALSGCMTLSAQGFSQANSFGLPAETCFGLNFADKTPPSQAGFLFDKIWVKADLITANNRFVRNDSLLFTFDKISQDIFLTDKHSVFKIDKGAIKSITFFCYNSTYTLEHVDGINDRELFLALVKSKDRYSLYRSVNSRWTNDEYKDREVYFIMRPDQEFIRLYSLNKNTLEHAFSLSGDKQKVNTFYSTHNTEGFNEKYLKELIEYLNE
jgi:hypothetical protein